MFMSWYLLADIPKYTPESLDFMYLKHSSFWGKIILLEGTLLLETVPFFGLTVEFLYKSEHIYFS